MWERDRTAPKSWRKWRTILSTALLGPSTWSLWKGVGGLWKESCRSARCFERVRNEVQTSFVFRKVTLLESLLWVQTVWDIQRLYILFIVCVCAYSPRPVFSGHGGASVDAMRSTYGESWGGTLTPTANSLGLWRPVGWLGVRHSPVHWTLPLHRVLLFSQVLFFLPLFSDNFFWIPPIHLWSWRFSCANISQLLWPFPLWTIFSTSCTVLSCYCRYCHRIIFLSASQSFYVLSLPNSDLCLSLSLFSLYDLNYDL